MVASSPPRPQPWTSLVAQMVKRLPTMQETPVQSLGQEDLLEKEMATRFNILAWKITWTMGSQRVGHDWATSLSFFLSFPVSSKECCRVLPAMFHSGMLLQDLLFLTFKISYPINHWCLCHCLWGLSSVLRLGLQGLQAFQVQPNTI